VLSKIAIEKTQVESAYQRQAISYTAGSFEALDPSTRCKADKGFEGFFSLTTFGKLIVNLCRQSDLLLKTESTSYHGIYPHFH
jgi:hypothetical protein